MNSQSIATYIANLEKENADLKKRLQQCEEMLQYAEVSDDESIASIGKGIIRKVNEFLRTFDTNENIADQLETLADLEENYHKSSAYQNAADTIRKLPFEVTNGTELLKIPGIGRGIANKIDEYIVTGEIRKISKHISQ
jgi:DNA polymerase/3'-5' exonuclease PolX